MKETPSISSAGEPPQEISTQEVDKAYKNKNACTQRLTTVYHNWNIEKELAETDLERQTVDEFYEEDKKKYTRKLEGWQEVIDMYADQELQKIEEQKYKERQYLQQRERERNITLNPKGRESVSFPKDQEETQVKAVTTGSSIVAPVSTPLAWTLEHKVYQVLM